MNRPMSQPDLPLVQWMALRGFTTRDLAEESGFALRTVENWTSRARRPNPTQRARLAAALGCTPDDLIDPNPREFQRPTNPTRRPMGTGGTIDAVRAATDLWRKANA